MVACPRSSCTSFTWTPLDSRMRGACVPEVVKAYLGQSGTLQGPLERAIGQQIGAQEAARAVGEDEAAVLPETPEPEPLGVLGGPVALEDSTAAPVSLMRRRLLALLGAVSAGPLWVWPSALRNRSVPVAPDPRSTSSQWSPSNSPCLIPVWTASTNRASRRSPRHASRKRRACSGESGVISLFWGRGGFTASHTLPVSGRRRRSA
jgi:hypothetical protein